MEQDIENGTQSPYICGTCKYWHQSEMRSGLAECMHVQPEEHPHAYALVVGDGARLLTARYFSCMEYRSISDE